MKNINDKNEKQCAIHNVVDMLPDLKEIADAKKKYIDRKMITGYSTKPGGVGNHFQDGVNWVLNYLTKKTKGN